MEVDVNTLFYLVEAGLIGLLLGIIAGRRAAKPSKSENEGNEGEARSDKPRKLVSLEEIVGVDTALAVEFYRNLKKAIKEKKIRIALVSELCPRGRIAYDFAVNKWVCIEKDGSVYPLGEKPSGETIIEEEDVGAIFKALERESDA